MSLFLSSTTLALSTLLVILVAWFVLENTVLDYMVRFIFTPYLGEDM